MGGLIPEGHELFMPEDEVGAWEGLMVPVQALSRHVITEEGRLFVSELRDGVHVNVLRAGVAQALGYVLRSKKRGASGGPCAWILQLAGAEAT